MAFEQAAAGLRSAMLRHGGEDITYLPGQGAGESIVEKAVVIDPEISEPRGPGFFAEIEVDPSVDRQRKDRVVWADGMIYTVTAVKNRAYRLTRLTLHEEARG